MTSNKTDNPVWTVEYYLVQSEQNPSFISSLIFRHEFVQSLQPSFIILELGLNSNESSGIKKQTENTQSCAGAYWKRTVFERHHES